MSERADGPTTWALDISDVSAGYDGHKALEGVTFRIEPGCLAGLVGPNGAGKSTLIKIVLGMLKPWSGEVSVFGRAGKPRPGSVSYTPQVDLVDWQFPVTVSDVVLMGLYGGPGGVRQEDSRDHGLTGRSNLIIYGRYVDIAREGTRTRADELLEFVQLDDRRDDRVDALSGGMKRRLTIARALVNRPELLLLDEPTTGLDPQARHLVWDRLYRLKRQGATLVRITHYMADAEQPCSRLVVL